MVHEAQCPCCGADGRRLEAQEPQAASGESQALGGLDRVSSKLGIGRRELIRTGVGLAVGSGALASMTRLGFAPVSAASKYNFRWPAPPIVSRQAWGANERLRGGPATYDSNVEKLVVHHTATPNGSRHARSTLVRNVYTYNLSRSYIDLAYNFVIDETGRIYEGRWAANYAAGATHTGENAKRQQVRGAHALYHNDRTIGIALLGTYDSVTPPAAMVNALVDLLAWKCARWAIDPVGASSYVDSRGKRAKLDNIVGHRDVRQTLCPGNATLAVMPLVRTRVKTRLAAAQSAYWVISNDGRMFANGAAPQIAAVTLPGGVVDAIDPHGRGGAWLLSPLGRVAAVGQAQHHGDAAKLNLKKPTVAIASSATGRGYFLVASDGGVFTFGDAKFRGSMGGKRLNAAMTAIAVTPTGNGYWMLGRDGGVFTFGDAKFAGSAWPCPSADPAVAILRTGTGKGYWIVQRSGRLRAFGDATPTRFVVAPTSPIVALRRGGGGLLGLTSNGAFVRTPSAPTLASVTKRLNGLVAVAAIGVV